jgi:disulfide bond formation protein DsbB
MVEKITLLIPYGVLVSHAVFVILVFSLLVKTEWARDVRAFLGKNALLLGFLVSLVAVAGSLFYSEIVGFEVCVLCWWQRVFLYPLVVIFGIALWRRNQSAFVYVLPLTILTTIVALYHVLANMWGISLLPCTAEGAACSKVFVNAFGYITIPIMSLTVCLYIFILAWADMAYKRITL